MYSARVGATVQTETATADAQTTKMSLMHRSRTALMNLLGAVLSPEGVGMVKKQMAADDVVAATGAGESGNGRPPVNGCGQNQFVGGRRS